LERTRGEGNAVPAEETRKRQVLNYHGIRTPQAIEETGIGAEKKKEGGETRSDYVAVRALRTELTEKEAPVKTLRDGDLYKPAGGQDKRGTRSARALQFPTTIDCTLKFKRSGRRGRGNQMISKRGEEHLPTQERTSRENILQYKARRGCAVTRHET